MDLEPVEAHPRDGEVLDRTADLVIRSWPLTVFLARVVDIVDGPGVESIVHLDVLGVPTQTIDELRHAGLPTA